jgi:SAM-dependent methyltransferase
VASVDAVEPSDVGWELSERRRADSATPVHRVGLDGQALDARDAAYDCVLSTFTLCTIPDVALALREVRRVLRPGGTFHILEHGSGPTDRVRRWQRRLEPVQRRVAGGCHLSRDVPALVKAAGLEVNDLQQRFLDGPGVTKPWVYLSLGRAS